VGFAARRLPRGTDASWPSETRDTFRRFGAFTLPAEKEVTKELLRARKLVVTDSRNGISIRGIAAAVMLSFWKYTSFTRFGAITRKCGKETKILVSLPGRKNMILLTPSGIGT
jgi:hypothetical protein